MVSKKDKSDGRSKEIERNHKRTQTKLTGTCDPKHWIQFTALTLNFPATSMA